MGEYGEYLFKFSLLCVHSKVDKFDHLEISKSLKEIIRKKAKNLHFSNGF